MPEEEHNPEKRIWILTAGALLLFAALFARLVDLQLVRNAYFLSAADAQRGRASELAPHRGTIYVSESRNDTREIFPVATNQKSWQVYAVPRDIDDPKATADTIAPALLAFRQRQQDRVSTIISETGQLLNQ